MSTGKSQGSRVLTLALRDRAALHAAFMPFIKNGGLFVATQQEYQIGDEVSLLLSLPDQAERVPVQGKVVWITPRGAQAGRSQGIGVQFSEGDHGALRARIETLLLGTKSAGRPTQTL